MKLPLVLSLLALLVSCSSPTPSYKGKSKDLEAKCVFVIKGDTGLIHDRKLADCRIGQSVMTQKPTKFIYPFISNYGFKRDTLLITGFSSWFSDTIVLRRAILIEEPHFRKGIDIVKSQVAFRLRFFRNLDFLSYC